MWLLSTDRAELTWFNTPPREYAILSHVWGPKEQSFQDVQALRSSSSSPNYNPRDHMSDKIRDCCIYAESQGYRWVWIDTCCIDKASSAELSEAINSMYEWYRTARVCYAFMHDVSADEDPSLPDSSFRKSRWFTRGWTLQELIAPRNVQFLSCEWIWFGDKILLAILLEQITRIDVDVLTLRTLPSSVPVAKRMWWASRRNTTRVEDEAYSLMGIFGVNLPAIYGEGRRAFIRLQEEIMRQSSDHTLFAWGPCFEFRIPMELDSDQNIPLKHRSLFAESPASFADDTLDLQLSSGQHFSASLSALSGEPTGGSNRSLVKQAGGSAVKQVLEIPEFTVTSHGVRARLPVIDILDASRQPIISLAILSCHIARASSIVALVLRPIPNQTQFHVGFAVHHAMRHHGDAQRQTARYVYFDPSHSFWKMLKPGDPPYTWRDIYIALPPPGNSTFIRSWVYFPTKHYVFVPYWSISRLKKLGFTPVATASCPDTSQFHTVRQVVSQTPTFRFTSLRRDDAFIVSVGIDLSNNSSLMLSAEVFSEGAATDSSWWWMSQEARVRGWPQTETHGMGPARFKVFTHRWEPAIKLRVTVMHLSSNHADNGHLWAVHLDFESYVPKPPPRPRQEATAPPLPPRRTPPPDYHPTDSAGPSVMFEGERIPAYSEHGYYS